MEVIARPPKSGKTQELIDRLRADPRAILIVLNWKRKSYLVHDMKIPGQRIFVYDQANLGAMLTSIGGEAHLMIDDADQILGRIFRRPVNVISITQP